MKKRVISLMLLFIIVMAGLPGLCIFAQASVTGFSAKDNIDGNIRKSGSYAIYTASSWASYEVTADEEGYYGVVFTYKCLPQDTGNLGTVEVSISNGEKECGTFSFKTDKTDATKRIAYVKLSEGTQTIKFTAESERGFRLSEVSLEPVEAISVPERAEKRAGAVQYILSGAESESKDGGAIGGITNDDGFVTLKNGQEISYLINISKAGNYDLYIVSGQRSDMTVTVNDGEGELLVSSSGNLNYGLDSSVCTLALDEGDHIIKLESDGNQMSLFGLYIANSELNIAKEIPADSEVTIEAENYNKASGTADGDALLLESEDFAKYDINILKGGEYEIKLVYASTDEAELSVDTGNETYLINLEAKSQNAEEIIAEGVIFEEGKSTLTFTVTAGEISADCIKIRRTGNLVPDLSDEITLEAEDYTESEGTAVSELDGETLLAFKDGSQALYTFNALEEETYQIVFYGVNEHKGDITVLYDDEVLCEKTLISKGNIYDSFILCNVNVTEGIHTVKIVSDTFKGKIDAFIVKKAVVSDKGTTAGAFISVLESNDRNVTNIYRNEKSKNPELPYVGMYECHGANWIDFGYDAPKAGKYEISVIAGAAGKVSVSLSYGENTITGSVKSTGDYSYGDEFVLGIAEFDKGMQTVRFVDGDGGLWVWGIIIRPLEQYLEINSVVSDNKILANGTVLPKGTTEFDIKFGSEVESAGNVTLVSENGEEIELVTKTEGYNVKVFVCESLEDDTDYCLYVSNSKGVYGGVIGGEEVFSFKTGGEDYANDTAVLTKKEKINNTAHLSYVVKTSADYGIKGRAFEVTLKKPDGTMSAEPVFSGETGEGGVADVTYSFAQSDMSGVYTFIAESEYTKENPVSAEIHFISDGRANKLLSDLEATNKDTIKVFFEENETELGINISEDMTNVPNPSKVYEKFAGSEFESFDDFREMYAKAVFTEAVNQALGTNTIDTLLADSKTYEITGIKKEKADIILADSGNQLSIRIASLAEIKEPELLISAVADIVDNELLKTAKKSVLTLKDKTISIYHGEAVEIPVEFNQTEKNIKSVVVKIKSDDTSFNEEFITVNALNNGKYSYELDSNVLTVEFTYENLAELNSAGSVVFIPENRKSSYDFKVSGDIFYDEKLNVKYDLSENILVRGQIPEKTYTVSATDRPQSGSGGGSSGGSDRVSSSGNVSGNVAPMPQTPQTPPKAFEFTDINNAEWAKESINELLKLGVVSESADGRFNPNDNITREQFVKLVIEALGLTDETAATTLADVDKNAWYYKYISSAEKCGVVTGSDGRFGIGQYVTREDMAVIIKRAMEIKKIAFSENTDAYFADDNMISDYAKAAVYGLKEFNIINGTGDNQFTPKGNATRAQAAKIIYEMIKAVNV